MVEQKKLDYISSYISKLLRKNFGRGPQSCQTSVCKKYVIAYVRGFVAPMEEVLLKEGHAKDVDRARRLIMNSLIEEIKGVLQVSLDVEVIEYYHDWNFPNNTGIFIFTLEKEEEGHIVNDVDIPKLEKEIARISELVQKVPDEIYTCPITPSIYCVERTGILIQIEKALIERGFEQELRYTKDQLEKSYFHRHGDFEEIFHKQVRDIFIDWNFHGNKSVLVFILF